MAILFVKISLSRISSSTISKSQSTFFVWLMSIFLAKLCSSYSWKNFISSSSFTGCFFKSLIVISSVPFTSIVTSSLLIKAKCSNSTIFSPSLPLMLCFTFNIFSSVPYSFKSLTAVFSPTPGIPGILSDGSPISAFKSII